MNEKNPEHSGDASEKSSRELEKSSLGNLENPKKYEKFDEFHEQSSVFKDIDTEDFKTRYDISKLISGLQRHIPTIILSAVIFFLLGSYATYMFITTYKAEAVVVYQEDKSIELAGGGSLPILTLPTVIEIIGLPINFEAVKKNLGLNISAEQIASMVSIPTPRNNSNLVRIVAKADNKSLAIDIANTLAKVVVKNSQDFNHRQLNSALENYEEQLKNVTQRLNSQLQEIGKFKEASGYLEMTADYKEFLSFVNETRNRLDTATSLYNSLLVEYNSLKSEVGNLPDQLLVPQSVYREGQINPMQARIISLQNNLLDAKLKYAKDNPKLRSLESELENLIAQLKNNPEDESKQIKFLTTNDAKAKLEIELIQMEGKVKAAEKVKDDLLLAYSQLQSQIEGLPTKQMTFARLLHNKQLVEDEVKFLTNAVELTQLMINLPRGSIELYQLANNAKSWKDSLLIRLLPIISAVLGTLFGMFMAMFIETKDNKFRTARQLEIAYRIPTIVTIPDFTVVNKKNSEDKFLFFIREIVEGIEKQFRKVRPLSIGITSSIQEEGKSLISFLLASYYVRLGKKVLLIETDYNNNPVTEATKLPLEHYLRNPGSNLSELISKHNGFDFIKVGPHKDRGINELIKSNAMQKLWHDLQSQYDIIIVDIPGIIDDNYGFNVINLVDVKLFVIDSTNTSKKNIDESLAQLSTRNILPNGIILNRVLPLYIDDQRILNEMKRLRSSFWKSLFFWKAD